MNLSQIAVLNSLPPDFKLITDEAAALMRISVKTLRNRLSAGDPTPRHVKVGHRVLFKKSDVDDFLNGIAPSPALTLATKKRGRPSYASKKLQQSQTTK